MWDACNNEIEAPYGMVAHLHLFNRTVQIRNSCARIFHGCMDEPRNCLQIEGEKKKIE